MKQAVVSVMLDYHLRYNCYPPIDHRLDGVAQKAIEMCNDGRGTTRMRLPAGCWINGKRSIFPLQVVEMLHLWEFIEPGDAE